MCSETYLRVPIFQYDRLYKPEKRGEEWMAEISYKEKISSKQLDSFFEEDE